MPLPKCGAQTYGGRLTSSTFGVPSIRSGWEAHLVTVVERVGVSQRIDQDQQSSERRPTLSGATGVRTLDRRGLVMAAVLNSQQCDGRREPDEHCADGRRDVTGSVANIEEDSPEKQGNEDGRPVHTRDAKCRRVYIAARWRYPQHSNCWTGVANE